MEEGEEPALQKKHLHQSLDQTFELSVAASTAATEKPVAMDDDEDVAALKSEVQRLKEKLQVCLVAYLLSSVKYEVN